MPSAQDLASLSIVFYDGECGICNRSVTFIWKNDPQGIFHFLSLQSDSAQQFLHHTGVSEVKFDTLYLHHNGEIYSRSDATAHILKSLAAKRWQFLGKTLKFIPKALRDLGYNTIAQNRHWLSPKAECPLPPNDVRKRFL